MQLLFRYGIAKMGCPFGGDPFFFVLRGEGVVEAAVHLLLVVCTYDAWVLKVHQLCKICLLSKSRVFFRKLVLVCSVQDCDEAGI